MCDIRLFKSAYTDFELAQEIYQIPRNDEAFLNGIAYHLQTSQDVQFRRMTSNGTVIIRFTENSYLFSILTDTTASP